MDKPRALLTAGRWLRGFLALAVLPAFATAPVVHGQCQYEVTAIIQAPPCLITGPPPTFAQGMNVHGHVVGYYWDCEISGTNHAFVWTPEDGLVTLPKPDAVSSSFASDINDAGFIVGGHRVPNPGGGWKGFIFDPQPQEYTYLEPLHPGISPETASSANAINNSKVVAGARVISEPGVSPHVRNAVIWDTNTGEVIDLGLVDGFNTLGEDITSHGVIIGWAGSTIASPSTQAILWTEGSAIKIGVLPGAVQSYARAGNDSGLVVGGSGMPSFGPVLAYAWANGKMIELMPPDGYEHVGSWAVNNVAQIVGAIRLENSSQTHPFLSQHGDIHNLLDLIIDLPSNLTLVRARLTNSKGQIIARGSLNGKTVAALLTPIDVPFADFNFDCTVNVHDLLELIANWGPAPDSKFDLTGNGVVNVFDLLFLLANWG